MNSHELAELKFLQFKLEETKHNYLMFLQSKNYKIVVHGDYENSEVKAIHKDYLENRYGYDLVKEGSPEWAKITLFELDSLLESYQPYEN